MIYNKRYEEKSEQEWLRERSQNIFWTILGDYEKNLPKRNASNDSDKANYQAIIWGAAFLYLEPATIGNFISYISKKTDFYSVFYQVLWLTIVEYCYPKLCMERPAISSLFLSFYQDYLEKYGDSAGKDSAEIIERAYYEEKLGRLDESNVWLRSLLNDIRLAAEKSKDTDSLITAVEDIYRRYFVTENWIDKLKGRAEVSELSSRKQSSFKPDESFMGGKRGVAPAEFYVEKIVDAEFNPNSYRGKASAEYLEEERQKGAKLASPKSGKKQSDFEKVWLYFGDLIMPMAEIERLEQKIGYGIHQHKKLYITDGSFSKVFSDYQIRFLEEQRNLNLEYLEVHYRACRRHIESLRSLLMNTLTPDDREESHRSKYGKLVSGDVWRASYLHDHNVFENVLKNEIGNFAVEVLLDGSGSQSERQAQVAMQGYIIAEALSLCKIPCRISAYATFLDYTILRVYKDFEDDMGRNNKIFDFFGTGMNRDGFAMRAVGELFGKRPEENKILIVLSDGRPNDVRVFKKNSANPEQEEYTGERAVRDTAMEIRKLRLKGISVFGVFNGEEKDLAAQQTIYGNDFAYIKKIQQFSKIVGAYLKKELRKFM